MAHKKNQPISACPNIGRLKILSSQQPIFCGSNTLLHLQLWHAKSFHMMIGMCTHAHVHSQLST